MSLPTTSLPTVVFLDRATIPRHIPLPALPFEHHWLSMMHVSLTKWLSAS